MSITTTAPEELSDNWTDLVGRLNHQSVDKHFDAYADVAWDDARLRDRPDRPALGADR